LATLEWVTRAENICIAGPSGTGKSHFAEALAHQAIDAGCGVAWFTLESLTAALGGLPSTHHAKAITRSPGATSSRSMTSACSPPGSQAAEALYRLVDAAYERRSLIVTSNLHPSGRDTIMPKTLATATVDRLLHHAHLHPHRGHQPAPRRGHRRKGSDAAGLTRREIS